MLAWVLGEKRYVYTQITASVPVLISGVSYEIFDISDESVVASGVASISNQIVYCLWQPEEVGVYVTQFDYIIGEESFTSSQVIEVKETI
jgi:hypothetical protein